MGYIFISYSHKDKEYVHKLHQHLFEHNLDAWIDDRLDYGSRWSYEIERRLKECVVFVLVMSPSSYDSEWVQNELDLVRELKKPIFTLLLEGDNWWHLRTIKYIDVRNKEMPSARFFVSLSNVVTEFTKKDISNVSINIEGNVQGNIVVGNNNEFQKNLNNSDKVTHELEVERKAEADQLAREKAEAERKTREKAEADRLTREKTEVERKAKEKAGADRLTREKAEAERKTREKAEADRLTREKTEAEIIKKNKWEFGTRQVVYGVIGAVLYGVLSWLFNLFSLPSIGNVVFRPSVAVLIFFSVAYGPWVGLVAGFIGNTIGDSMSGWGFYWNWGLGNGLIGFVAGLVIMEIKDFRAQSNIIKAVGWGIAGGAVGMLFSSLTEIFVSGIDLNTALVGYFTPAFIGNAVVIVVLLPILMIAFATIVVSRGR